jgi:hypothetical protein
MSHVSSGAVLTLVVPLSLLVVVIAIWWALGRRWLRVGSETAVTPERPPEA